MNPETQEDMANTFPIDTYIVPDDFDLLDNSDDSNTDDMHKSFAPLREQDRFLPIANVAKIMKKAIPDNGKIAKDARECVQECVSEFISFITSEASERCHMEKRKTINGEDILFAMNALGFENYVQPLKLYLQKYRENSKPDRNLPEETDPLYEDIGENLNKDGARVVTTTNGNDPGNNDTIIYIYPDRTESCTISGNF